jgi:hypothetical protein
MRQVGASDQEAHEAAVAAVRTVLPLPWKEASVDLLQQLNRQKVGKPLNSPWARHKAKLSGRHRRLRGGLAN